VLSCVGWGLCGELITRSEESYQTSVFEAGKILTRAVEPLMMMMNIVEELEHYRKKWK
jgi:predicted transcriptional regulator